MERNPEWLASVKSIQFACKGIKIIVKMLAVFSVVEDYNFIQYLFVDLTDLRAKNVNSISKAMT